MFLTHTVQMKQTWDTLLVFQLMSVLNPHGSDETVVAQKWYEIYLDEFLTHTVQMKPVAFYFKKLQ